MSLEAMVWAMRQPFNDKGEKLVLLSLANYADANGFCWPGYEKLKEDSLIKSDSTISAKLNTLEARGLIDRKRRPKLEGGSSSNVYRLNLGAIYPLSDTPKLRKLEFPETPKKEAETPKIGDSFSIDSCQYRTSQLNILCDSFEIWWKGYPKRQGSKGNKKTAERTYLRHLKNGFSEQDLLNAVDRYRHYCDITGKTGTEYVKQATTFLNDTGNFENAWTVNHENNKRASGCRNQKQETIAAIWGAPGVGSDPRADQRGQAAASERPVQDHAVEETASVDLGLPDAGDH